MSKGKKIIIFIIVLLIVISGITIFVFYYTPKNTLNNNVEKETKEYGLVAKKIIDDNNVLVFNDGYIKKEGTQNLWYDLNDNFIAILNYYYINDFNDNLYYVEENGIYDTDGLIYAIPSNNYDISYRDNYIILSLFNDKILIDLETREAVAVSNVLIMDNYIYVEDFNENKVYLYNSKESGLIGVYNNCVEDFYNNIIKFYGDDGNAFLINGNLYTDIYYLNDNLSADYNVCDEGAKLYANNNVLIDGCYLEYELLDNGFIKANSIADESYIYDSFGNLLLESEYLEVVGNYLIGDNVIINSSDLSSKIEKKDYFDDFEFYQNNYVFSARGKDYNIVDNDFNVLKGPYYSLDCLDDICIYQTNDGYYGILKDMEEIDVSKEFIDMYFVSDSIVGVTYNKTYVMEISNETNNIELEDVSYQDKFNYIVKNNDNLNGFNDLVLEVDDVIQKYRNYLNENYFLWSLTRLNVSAVQSSTDDSWAGLYTNSEKKIEYIPIYLDDSNHVFYHELFHFLDDSINFSDNDFNEILYMCDDELLDYFAISKLPFSEKLMCENVYINIYNFLVEAGAEAGVAKTFTNQITAYNNIVSIYTMLEYLFGSNVIDDIYMSNRTFYLLLKLLIDSGYTFEEAVDINNFFVLLKDDYDYNDDALIDIMSDLYTKVKGGNYANDKQFVYLLGTYFGGRINYTNFSNVISYEEFVDKYTYSIFNEILDNNFGLRFVPGDGIFINNEFKISLPLHYYGGEEAEPAVLLVDYDFINDEILDWSTVIF